MKRLLSWRSLAAAALAAGLWMASITASAAGKPAAPMAYPPNWWVGMRDARLQLMAQGAGIGAAEATLDDTSRAKIVKLTRGDSPNYLFIDLRIAADATPGDLVFRFARSGVEHVIRYPLLARAPGSADRRGFDTRDVILNLMPDRFANGDPRNDRVAGYVEAADRSKPGGRHGGDLRGMTQHLDHIAGMGYTMVWPTPLIENAQFNDSYHGYAATDLYRIDPRFGSNVEYREFVAAARSKGIGVIQDVVPNHIGDGHPWLKDPPTADWITLGGRFEPTRHGRTAVADPYAAQTDRDNFTQGWFVAAMPDLNQQQPLLATYLTQNTIWWIEYAGLSGLRVDTFGYSDNAFLAEWTQRIRSEYPKFSMVGEEWSANASVVARWQNGWIDGKPGMPNMMDFPLSETLRTALSEPENDYAGGLRRLYEAMVNDRLYTAPTALVAFEGNHDMPRLYSVLGDNLHSYRIALAYLATIPRIPQLYYGTEVLMTSPTTRDDAASRRDFPGGWPGDRINAFTGAGLTPLQTEAQTWLRTLLNWRKTATAVHRGRFLHYLPHDGVYVYFRDDGAQRLMIVLSRNDAAAELQLERFAEGLKGATAARDALTGASVEIGATLAVPAHAALILELCTPSRAC
ncbi:MAG: glycoside hydrolase family 13 protein [Xanthomonadales bacterium]|nr:glycoside hydrolase family 13 protein [Xanthomonadales bacterium]